MKTMVSLLPFAGLLLLMHGVPTVAEPNPSLGNSSLAIADDLFLQEVAWQYASPSPLTAVGAFGSELFVGTGESLLRFDGKKFRAVETVKGGIRRLVNAGETLWAFGNAQLWSYNGQEWQLASEGGFADAAVFDGKTVFSAGNQVGIIKEHRFAPVCTNQAPFGIHHLAAFNDSLYIQGGHRLTFFDGAQFGAADMYGFPADNAWDFGSLPSSNVRDMLPLGSCLYFATDRGLGVLRGMSMSSIRGESGLPYEDLTCLARGFTNDLWIGTSRGAIRKIGAQYHYFAGERWLPRDHVNAIATLERSVFLATDGGLAIIKYEPMTLEGKAAYYEKHLRDWGQKRLGFVHKLEWDPSLNEYVREVSDNDGGFSSDYLAAQSYRYAVTHDPAARAEAVNTFKSLVWLERMTGIPGFIARSVWAKGERGHKAMGGSGGYPAEWHDVSGAPFEWKGDTSSDELSGHFYGVSLFLELAAQGEEIPLGKRHLNRIASHLIDHNWQLIDVDGKPTRWGRWDPEYFQTEEGRFDRGLQSVELLSFMKAAGHFSGEQKFIAAYKQLVDLGYPAYTLRQRQLFPPESVANFDDQLALWSYWNLLRRETDPPLKSIYRRSFERTWEILRIEQQPWFNFVYGALTGNDCEAGKAVEHLREWPLDLVIWSYRNSHRADLHTPAGYTAYKNSPRAFSPREREPMRWDNWTMQADGGTGGNDVVEPSGWLLAYWMGRYHGFITAPQEHPNWDVPMQIRRGTRAGAEPYIGPGRPELNLKGPNPGDQTISKPQ